MVRPDEDSRRPTGQPGGQPGGQPEPRRERVLVLEDERHARESLCRGLFLQGYEPVGAGSLPEALARLADSRRGGVDLLIMGLSENERSSLRLLEQLHEAHPGLPVVVVVGLARTTAVLELQGRGIPTIQRPFDPEGLARAVREVIDSRPIGSRPTDSRPIGSRPLPPA